MASLSRRRSTGGYSIQFEDRDAIRRTITLGQVPKRDAETIRRHVEALVYAQIASTAPADATGRWLAAVGEKLSTKLAKVGLVDERKAGTVGAFIDEFIKAKQADPNIKPRTIISYTAPFASIRKTFGNNRALRSITKAEAKAWRNSIAKGKAENTTRKWVSKVQTLFNAAIESELIEKNPFNGFPAGTMRIRERDFFITDEMAKKVLEACPSLEWKIIFAMARYGGLRCPSELSELRWGDILWDQKRFIVHCVKVEHHEGHETRVVPLFAELEALLRQAFDEAEEGTEFVIRRIRDGNINLRTQLQRIIAKAGLKPWPKLFQNLRATRATELSENFPGHVAAAWLGHSVEVAKESYWQVTDDHFNAAISQSAANALQPALQSNRTELKLKIPESTNAGVFNLLQLLNTGQVAEEGLETTMQTPVK